jgi:hypothetical protein
MRNGADVQKEAIRHNWIKFEPSFLQPIQVQARSKEWVCGRSLAGISDSNPAGDMDVCLLWVLCFVRRRITECDLETSMTDSPRATTAVEP